MEPIKEENVRYPLSMPLNACRAAHLSCHCSLPAITRIHYRGQQLQLSPSSLFFSLGISSSLLSRTSRCSPVPTHRVAVQRELVREGGEKPVE